MAAIEKRQTSKGETRWRAKVLVRYNATTGKTKFISKTFGSKKEAEDWGKEREVERGKGKLVEPTRETFAEYTRRYLDDVIRGRVRERTYAGYSCVLRRYLEDPPDGAPLIGDVKLTQLHSELLQRLYGWMQWKRGLSPGTIRSLHAVVRQALAHAERTGAAARNEADLVVLPEIQKPEVEAMSLEELRRFLRAAEGDRLAPLWILLPTTGLRPGEALGLKWEDLDLDEGKLHVRRSLSRVSGSRWKLTPPKTSRSRRTIILPQPATHALRQWRSEQAKLRLKAGSEWSDHGLVFTTGSGEPLDWTNLSRSFERVMAKAEIGEWQEPPAKPRGRPGPNKRRKFKPKYRAYALRHTHATLLLRRGMNPKVISERLGHFSVGFTLDVYAAPMEDLQHEAVAEMEEMIREAAEG